MKLNDKERKELIVLRYPYIARDKDGGLWLHEEEPQKKGDIWDVDFGMSCSLDEKGFKDIRWEDEKATLTEDLLKEE